MYHMARNLSMQTFRYITSHKRHISLRFCSCFSSFTWRSHTCGELTPEHTGQEVTLCGWTTYARCDKFLILRDTYGQTQIIFSQDDPLMKKFVNSLPLESVIQVTGTVKKRPPKDVNKKLATGGVEVEASDIKLLNLSDPKLPISTKDQERATEAIRYKYRYLSLRSAKLQENLKVRSKFLLKMREFLQNEHGFIDIETPTLFKRTPGGAKEFIVPTKFPGRCYSLTQSPQQFKQLLMVAGFDRYFQIARCYRNEGTKTDRQPEFTQVDIEMSFTTSKDVQKLIEDLLESSWPNDKGSFKTPFPCMKYDEAMRVYGTDKPDIRFGMKLQDLTEEFKATDLRLASQCKEDSNFIVNCIVVPGGAKLLKPSFLKELQKLAESLSSTCIHIAIKDNLGWSSSLSKHLSSDFQLRISEALSVKRDDLLLLAFGKSFATRTFLGKARVNCAEQLNFMKTDQLQFLWVTDFPMFLQNEEGILESAHHPFTAPHADDTDVIYSCPTKARSQHYDLVLNGQEIGGGSIRIHDANLQRHILEDVLRVDSSDLQHLLQALSSGCPPHGGIALGVDRILSIMCGCRSITDVIAFPKSLDGKDLMSGAPGEITEEEKILYHINPVIPNN